MIEVKNLIKSFGSFRAVDDLSFSVPTGQVLGFLGPNGAGKTTTMRVITGALSATSGTVTIDGVDVSQDLIQTQKRIGYLAESAPSYGEMTVAEFLSFIADVRGLTGQEKSQALERVKQQCFLAEMWNVLIETLSKGYRQRVGFAQAVIHDPPVLILDEPTDGLDPNQKYEVRRFIKTLGEKKTIIVSTHILEEVEALCSRVLIIAHGKLMADETPQDLAKMSSEYNAVTLTLSTAVNEQQLANLQQINGYEKVEQVSERVITFWPQNQANIVHQAMQDLKQQGLEVYNVNVSTGRLDEVFRNLTVGG